MSRPAVALGLVLLATAPGPVAAGPCARGELLALARSPRGERIPADGGVLVASVDSGPHGSAGGRGGDPTTRGGWTFDPARDEAGADQATVAEHLGPGLVRFVPGAPLRGERVTLRDADGAAVFDGVVDADGAAFAAKAPAVASVKTAQRKYRQGGSSRSWATSWTTTVVLEKRPPPGAVVLLMLRVDGDATTAIAWTAADLDAGKTFEIYTSPSRCETSPDGLEPAEVGDRVRLVWIDGFGRRSPASAKIKVKRGR